MSDLLKPVRWGVVATGGMATVFVTDLLRVPGAEVAAVSSRDLARARDFAQRHGIPRHYDDYRALLADADIDVVYVATPHSQHHEVASAALRAGKHVLCEKPLTVSAAQTEDLVGLARQSGRLLVEAMWTRFNPLVQQARELVADGAIGQLRSVRADFGVVAPPVAPDHRLWDPAKGGGALLDLGVYPVSLAHLLLGEPDDVLVHGRLADTGVDAEAALLLCYPDGVHAYASCSLLADSPLTATVLGTAGRIELAAPFYRPTELTLVRGDAEPEVRRIDLLGAGYTYQALEVMNLVRAGRTESPHMPLADSAAVARTLARALDRLGVRHPEPA
ncbi:Gfo/Idh/MocA family protein [Goodfellowiella coeruleoviolacea]|uniref:Dehydrogenase n=1 Tax=Goodfellowiella coeruleoviolacea TaxID=334858 RepID=A0AAE3GB66_9PSEU|nr:Gfo/Idh/MocA family oxidoreductase [Goodfellowiella coeruleoviolacea]MCP2164175.1 putative dehydrogenase [Goodfellowiella coeruleoviolacea]